MLIRTSFLLLAAAALHAQIVVRTNFENGNIGRVDRGIAHAPALRGSGAGRPRPAQPAGRLVLLRAESPADARDHRLVDLAGEYNYKRPAFSVTKGTRPVYSYDGVNWTPLSRRPGDLGQPGAAPDPDVHAGARPHVDRARPALYERDLAALLGRFRGSPT